MNLSLQFTSLPGSVRSEFVNLSSFHGCGLVPQKVPSEANPKVRNHGEGPY